MKKIVFAAAALTMTLGVASPALAKEDPKAAEVQILGPVRIDGDVAYVTARYRCSVSDHLFVSVKQVGDRKHDDRLTQPGSSAVVAQTGGGWWQSHPLDFTCDGASHTATYTIGTFEYGISELQQGKGWLQFCLSYGDEQIEAIETRWVEVIG